VDVLAKNVDDAGHDMDLQKYCTVNWENLFRVLQSH
jgi:hypothetical protein